MNTKVNKTDIRFFTSSDYEVAKREYEKWVEAKKCVKPKDGNAVLGIYFDDGEDYYKTTRFDSAGGVFCHDCYSWDELSQYIHDII